MSELPDISEMRGLGEPLFFSFNIVKGKRLLCHAIIFASFVPPEDQLLSLCKEEDDPRMTHFLKYVWENCFKDKKESMERARKLLKEYSDEARAKVDQPHKEIAEDEKKIEELKRKAADEPTH